jgi:AcrR family transcriptional regulator
MDKKQQILEAATRLFAEKGFEGVSIRDLAAEAGINVAMVNYYFGSKEKLFEAVVEYRAEYLKSVLTSLSENKTLSGIEKMEAVIVSLVNRVMDNPSFHQLIHRELSIAERPELHERIINISVNNAMVIKKIITEGIKSGEFKEVDAELTVTTLFGTSAQLLISKDLCNTFFKKENTYQPYSDNKFRERVINHLTGLMRSHLLKKN